MSFMYLYHCITVWGLWCGTHCGSLPSCNEVFLFLVTSPSIFVTIPTQHANNKHSIKPMGKPKEHHCYIILTCWLNSCLQKLRLVCLERHPAKLLGICWNSSSCHGRWWCHQICRCLPPLPLFEPRLKYFSIFSIPGYTQLHTWSLLEVKTLIPHDWWNPKSFLRKCDQIPG